MPITPALVLLLAGPVGQAPPPPPPPAVQMPTRDPARRPPPEPAGTGVIRGRVVAADTGTPIRRANVTLSMTSAMVQASSSGTATGAPAGVGARTTIVSGAAPAQGQPAQNLAVSLRPRTATTDSQGVFEFKELPPGSYRIVASPGQYSAGYLQMAFGAKKPAAPGTFDPGTPIELADGQSFTRASIALMRGGVIAGRVTDDTGQPVARMQVFSMAYQPGSPRGTRVGGVQTDDLGQFRLFGLGPGDYAVVAEARLNTFVQPDAPPETEDDRVGFLTTYYPNTPVEAAAQRVRVRAAAETPGVEIQVASGRLLHVTGTVTDSQGNPAGRASGSLWTRVGSSFSSSYGFSVDEHGRFQMRNVPPGTYRLTVRLPAQPPPQGAPGPDGPRQNPGEFASVPVTATADIEGLAITTSPGATITGTIVFEDGPPQLPAQQPFQMRVNASPGDPDSMMGLGFPPPVLVAPDLSFTFKGLGGELLLRTGAPGAYLKAVRLGGDDITDSPHEFKTGDHVTLLMTSRASTLEGAVTDAAGKPGTDAGIVLFSDDKVSWRANALRSRRAFADPQGRYRLTGLLPGRYFIIALPRDRMTGLGAGTEATLYEALVKDATTVVIGEDEQRQADLKLALPDNGG